MAPLSQEAALKVLSELAGGVAQLEAHFRAPAEPAPVTTATSTLTETELAKKRDELKALEERITAAETRLFTANQEYTTLEANTKAMTARLEEERAAAEKLRAQETERQGAAAAHQQASAAQWEQQRVASEAETARLAEQRTAAEAEAARLAELRATTEKAAAEVEHWRTAASQATHLQEKLWPDWLRAGSLAAWKEKLEGAVGSGTATPAAALLFAALHGYTAATKDSDPKLLHDSLREVSRRLFSWLREQGLEETAAVEQAGQFAREINQELAGRSEVEIPTPGSPATNQWMIFRPRPGANSPDVVSIQTWCVRNAQKQPIHRAEVTV